MTDLVSPDEIEAIVGRPRHPDLHFGRVVTSEQKIYILHSGKCKDSGIDLRECLFSQALDEWGIDLEDWVEAQDHAVAVYLHEGCLMPYKRVTE